jgi:uncharacterized protein YigE (DUF2233 family)
MSEQTAGRQAGQIGGRWAALRFTLLLPLLLPLLLAALSLPAQEAPDLKVARIPFGGGEFDTAVVPLERFLLHLLWQDELGQPYYTIGAARLALEVRELRPLLVTNGGIYLPGFKPMGLHVAEGRQQVPLNRWHGGGNFFMQPNGVFFIEQGRAAIQETAAYHRAGHHPELAVQSGPLLVIDGELHPQFRAGSESAYIRNGVGVDRQGRVVFAIADEPVNFHTFASLFRDALDCPNALYLDGNLARMYLPALARYDDGGPFAAMLAVTPRE